MQRDPSDDPNQDFEHDFDEDDLDEDDLDEVGSDLTVETAELAIPATLERVGVLSFGEEPAPLRGVAGRLVESGRARADRFMDRATSQPPGGFLAGDYEGFAHALNQGLANGILPRRARFCEWGSGVGVVTLLAELAGWDPSGIELQDALVAEARRLASEFELRARFVEGSYVPAGWAASRESDGTALHRLSGLRNEGPDGYALLGRRPEDFDITYVFPHPVDEAAVLDLFADLARPGSLLLCYRGEEDLEVLRRRAR